MKRIIRVVAGLTLRSDGLSEQVLGVAIAQRRYGHTMVLFAHAEAGHKFLRWRSNRHVDHFLEDCLCAYYIL